MTSKFFPSVRAAVSGVGLWLAVAGAALAQSPAPSAAASPGASPSPSPTPKPKAGFVRFFNALPLTGPTLELVIGADANARVLQTAEPLTVIAPYHNMAPGRYSVSVCKVGDRKNPLKTIDLILRDKVYCTLLASQQTGGQPTVELLDETPNPEKITPNQITVRQFCPNGNVIVSAGSQQTGPLLYGQMQILTGLPDSTVPLQVRATLTPGGKKTWTSEADFRVVHRATLFIVTDSYGRMRTRLSADGPSVAEEAANASPSPKP